MAGLWPVAGSRAMVVGAGGVATAVVLALSRVPVERTTVVARRINAARALIDRLAGAASTGDIAVGLWDEDYLERLVATADIVVNATSAGLRDMPFTPARLQASCTVADVRYRPRPVDLVAAAPEVRAAQLRRRRHAAAPGHAQLPPLDGRRGAAVRRRPWRADGRARRMSAAAAAVAAPVGAVVGLGAGWLSVSSSASSASRRRTARIATRTSATSRRRRSRQPRRARRPQRPRRGPRSATAGPGSNAFCPRCWRRWVRRLRRPRPLRQRTGHPPFVGGASSCRSSASTSSTG